MKLPLAGRGVVVTRPAHQAAPLAALIAAAGGKPILFPTIEIVAAGDLKPLLELIDRLEEFDIAIFVSPNAVTQAMSLARARRELPPRLELAAVGRGSVRELERFGVSRAMAPAQFDSEGLLDLPEIRDVAAKRIVIFRGEGGREVLGDTLQARGASVEYAECYRRGRPDTDAGPLLRAWQQRELHAITVTSSEGLRNLFALVGASGEPQLRATPLFAPHPRIGQAARELGCAAVTITAQGDEGLVQGLTEWFGIRETPPPRPQGSIGE
jgi:uroporphyrinogen-III synthase